MIMMMVLRNREELIREKGAAQIDTKEQNMIEGASEASTGAREAGGL